MNQDWLVIGWYTPDYTELAQKFRKNLEKYHIPYEIYPVESRGKWDTQRKPEIVLRAMQDYPSKTLVLMDVDCIVHGDISKITKFEGDVAISGHTSHHKRKMGRITIQTSSRVIVFKPTKGADDFVRRWQQEIIKRRDNRDEYQMAQAFLRSIKDVKFSYIDKKYSGKHVGLVHNAAIEHDSEFDKRYNSWFKRISNKLFRTGRTKNEKLTADLGH